MKIVSKISLFLILLGCQNVDNPEESMSIMEDPAAVSVSPSTWTDQETRGEELSSNPYKYIDSAIYSGNIDSVGKQCARRVSLAEYKG